MAGPLDANFLTPNTPNTATAVPGWKSARSDMIYSSVVLAHGGNGPVKAFTVPGGQGIPVLTGQATKPAQVWQQTHDDHSTNLKQASVLGDALGDAAIHTIAIDFENAAYTAASGVPRTFGATMFEVADITSKMSFLFKVKGVEQTKGAIEYFPGLGGLTGSISTTATGATASIASNGVPGLGNRYDWPIMVAAANAIEAVLATGNGAALAFSSTASDGQPVLTRVCLKAFTNLDVTP
jgi:hypothetical protein